MKKLLSLVLTLMLTLALFAPAMAEEAAPKIVYEGFLAMRVFEGRGDSDPEAYAAIHDMILEDTGVDAVPVWFPYGAEDERRNLMIADDSQQLDIIMSGDWAEYADSGVIAPLNDLLEEYGWTFSRRTPSSRASGTSSPIRKRATFTAFRARWI